MTIIDLSIPLNEKTPAYPGDPKIEIEQIAIHEKNGWNEKRIHCNTHCGTHVDAPSHMIQKGKTLDEIPLEAFQGKGILIDVRKKEITMKCLKEHKIMPDHVVLFFTGQSDQLYTNYYEHAKFIPPDVAHELVQLKVKAVGIDSFSPDQEPYPIHKILLLKNIIIIENLTNLKALLGKKFQVHYFPLKITNGDGAPCRALALVE